MLIVFVLYFNSIKVRLKLVGLLRRVFHHRRFQFHKGTIKTRRAYAFTFAAAYFNSIKVRLKRTSTNHSSGSHRHFNSIKVRLKLTSSSQNSLVLSFQFHKGTIKTKQYLLQTTEINKHFNSIKVRLKPQTEESRVVGFRISIP